MGQEMAYQRDHKIILQKSKCLVQNKKQKKKTFNSCHICNIFNLSSFFTFQNLQFLQLLIHGIKNFTSAILIP